MGERHNSCDTLVSHAMEQETGIRLRRSLGWVLKLLKDCTGLQSVPLRNHNPRGSPPDSGHSDRTLEQVPFDYRPDAGVLESQFQQVGLEAMLGPVDLDQTSLAH